MANDKHNILYVDFETNEAWPFFRPFRESGWILKKKVCNLSQRNVFNSLKRYICYISIGFKSFCERRSVGKFVAWQQFFGLFYCYFLHIFHSKTETDIYILTFIYKKKSGLIGKMYHSFIVKALSVQQLKRVFVLSNYEVEYYSSLFKLDKSLFCAEKIGLDTKRLFEPEKGSFYLSAGRSNRDYVFLVEAFRSFPKRSLVIVCDTLKVDNLPDNITVLTNCFNEDYELLLSKSFAVILSLSDEPISCGQLVLNNAFNYGKPVIVTNNPGITDYIIDRHNGIVIGKNIEDLNDALNWLESSDNYQDISGKSKPYSELEYGHSVFNQITLG